MLNINLSINDTHYSEHDFEQLYAHFDTMPLLNDAVAVCFDEPFIQLALCFYLKQHNVSVLPIHPSLPITSAQQLARRAKCQTLFYKNLDSALHIEEPATVSDNSRLKKENKKAGLIQMSSGTTGEPKCIKRSWAEIDFEIKNYISLFKQADKMQAVIACPVTHSYGLIAGVMVALARGQQPLIITNINPKYLMKKLLACDKPLLYSSPLMLQGLAQFWPKGSQLHAAMTSGSTMSSQIYQQLSNKITYLYQQYGCSEAGCISISLNMDCATDLGEALPHISLSCSDNSAHPSELIANITTPHGIKTINTQDLCYLEKKLTDDGVSATLKNKLRFVSRSDDTIIVAGLNVYPQDVEETILKHPDIDDLVVFKVDDAIAGNRVALQYTSKKTVDPMQLRQWCKSRLAQFQQPFHLTQVDKIERLANSKINRKAIASEFITQQKQLLQSVKPATNTV